MPNEQYYQSAEWGAVRVRVLRRDRYTCSLCGQRALGKRVNGLSPVVDHIVPRAQGGSDAPHNLRVLCLPCHNKKTAHVDYNTKDEVGLDGYPVNGW